RPSSPPKQRLETNSVGTSTTWSSSPAGEYRATAAPLPSAIQIPPSTSTASPSASPDSLSRSTRADSPSNATTAPLAKSHAYTVEPSGENPIPFGHWMPPNSSSGPPTPTLITSPVTRRSP